MIWISISHLGGICSLEWSADYAAYQATSTIMIISSCLLERALWLILRRLWRGHCG